jgi:tripartite ATP-independent transporter DctP family solute receptor
MRAKQLCYIVILVLISVCFTFSSVYAAEIFDVKYATGMNVKQPVYKGIIKYKEIIESKTDQLKITVYHTAQLGPEMTMLQGLQLGTIDMATLTTGPIDSFVPVFKVLQLPFLFPNEDCVNYVLDGPVGRKLLDKLSDVKIKGLTFWAFGYRNVSNNICPIRNPEDLKGLKIRTMQSPIFIDVFKTLRANPTPMDFPEVYSALKQGVIDGQENPYEVLVNFKLFEVQKYLSNTQHTYQPTIVLASQKFWKNLPEHLKIILIESAFEARGWERMAVHEASMKALEFLKGKMKVTTLGYSELAGFKKASQPVYDKVAKEIGVEWIEAVNNEIEQFMKAR